MHLDVCHQEKPHTVVHKKRKTHFTYVSSLVSILKKISKKTNQTSPPLNSIKSQIFQ